jgi:hypothetical protein
MGWWLDTGLMQGLQGDDNKESEEVASGAGFKAS